MKPRPWMTPQTNLGVQTQIVAGARAFVGDAGTLQLVEPGAQHLQRLRLVLVLRLLVLLDDDEAGGQMGDAHGAVGGVDRLAAGPG